MKIETYIHKGVKEDGTFEHEAGAVHVEGNVGLSAPGGGCGASGCKCSPGHWISAALPRDSDGVVRGFTIRFKSREELLNYIGLADKKDYRRK
jgi:hypothetical protein